MADLSSVKFHQRYNILIEFAHKHLDFHRAELISVLSMHGFVIGKDCIEIPLPNSSNLQTTTTANNSAASTKDTSSEHSRPYLILSFSYEDANQKFNIDETNHTDGIGSLDKGAAPTTTTNTEKPSIASILSRCTLVRSAIELWGMGTTQENCGLHVKSMSQHPHSLDLLNRHRDKSRSWKITVQTLGTKYTRDEQNDMRREFSFLDYNGPVQMENPTNEFIIIRESELNSTGSPKYPRFGIHKNLIPENDARPPLGVYYGRILGGTRDWRGGGRLEKYNLKKRAYLGPTSMDAELSLIMTNLGLVQKGSFCFDPFVGTGSILLTCGLRGAYCFGTDIDIRVLRGRSADENVLSNFEQYNLPKPDLVRCDNAIYHRHYRSHRPMYDAIITDPPYGIRAGARKSGSRLDQPRPVPEDRRHDHIAQTKPYAVSDVMADLLDVAARTLVMGGRLVYVIPSMTDFDEKEDLPHHDCLKVVHVCYQPLQIELGRRIIAMEKVEEYDESQREEYKRKVWKNGPESAEKCANIRDRLLEAAKSKPGYQEKAAMRKKRKKETKEAKKRAKSEKS